MLGLLGLWIKAAVNQIKPNTDAFSPLFVELQKFLMLPYNQMYSNNKPKKQVLGYVHPAIFSSGRS